MALLALTAVAFGKERTPFLMLAVPLVAPMVRLVAPSAKLTVVAVTSLTKLKVDWLVLIVPPLTAKVPSVERFPFEPVREKWVAVMLPAPRAKALVMLASERSIAVVTTPLETPATFKPIGKVLVCWFWIKTNWLGSTEPVPLALVKAEYAVELAGVMTEKLELEPARLKVISFELEVVIVLPVL